MTSLDRYLAVAIGKPFAAMLCALAVVSPFFILTHQSDMLVSGVSVAAWFAASFAFTRLVRDGEIGALRANGSSLARLIRAPTAVVACGVILAVCVASLADPHATPAALRSAQVVASVLAVAATLPLAIRYAKRDAYLPGGLALGGLIAFDVIVGLVWGTSRGPWEGSLRVVAFDIVTVVTTIWYVRQAEWQ